MFVKEVKKKQFYLCVQLLCCLAEIGGRLGVKDSNISGEGVTKELTQIPEKKTDSSLWSTSNDAALWKNKK